MISESIDIDVPFYDVDAYRVVWHGSYPRYFEEARCALLKKIGFTYIDMEKAGYFFPVIDMHVKYVKPILFQQLIRVTATLVEWEYKLIIRYRIVDANTFEKLTDGHTHQIAVAMPSEVTQFQMPSVFSSAIEAYLAHA